MTTSFHFMHRNVQVTSSIAVIIQISGWHLLSVCEPLYQTTRGSSPPDKYEKIRKSSRNTDCLHDRAAGPVFGYITCRVRDDGDVSLDDWRTTVHHVASQCRTSPGFPVAAWRESASSAVSVRAQNGRKNGRKIALRRECAGHSVEQGRNERRKGRSIVNDCECVDGSVRAEARTIPYLRMAPLLRTQGLRAKLL